MEDGEIGAGPVRCCRSSLALDPASRSIWHESHQAPPQLGLRSQLGWRHCFMDIRAAVRSTSNRTLALARSAHR